MRILYVLPEYGTTVRGGIATFYGQLLPGLVDAGCDIDVLVVGEMSQCADFQSKRGITVSVVSPELIGNAWQKLGHFAVCPSTRQALARAYAAWETCHRGLGYDVVETTDFALLFVPWLAAVGGPPVVVQLHGSIGQIDYYDPISGNELNGLFARLLETALLGRAEELQCYGPANGREWSRLLLRPVEHIWPAWGAKDGKEPGRIGLDLSCSGITIGRIQSWKGPEVLCQAVALLGNVAPKIYWVGRDHPYGRLDQSMSAYLEGSYPGVWGTKILHVGEHSADVVSLMQRKARFVVIPSTWDTFNLAAVESLFQENIVICSEGAGAADLIEHGVNGFRFAANDSRTLADLIIRVNEMPDTERISIGKRGRATILEKLSRDKIAAQRLCRYQIMKAQGARRQTSLWGDSLFSAVSDTRELGFLSNVPLKAIVTHVMQRTSSRARRIFR